MRNLVILAALGGVLGSCGFVVGRYASAKSASSAGSPVASVARPSKYSSAF